MMEFLTGFTTARYSVFWHPQPRARLTVFAPWDVKPVSFKYLDL